MYKRPGIDKFKTLASNSAIIIPVSAIIQQSNISILFIHQLHYAVDQSHFSFPNGIYTTKTYYLIRNRIRISRLSG